MDDDEAPLDHEGAFGELLILSLQMSAIISRLSGSNHLLWTLVLKISDVPAKSKTSLEKYTEEMLKLSEEADKVLKEVRKIGDNYFKESPK